MRLWGRLWGTLRLYCKAKCFGIELSPGIRAHGAVGLMRWPGGKIRIGANTSFISSWRRASAAALAWPVRLRVFGPGAFIDIGEGCELSGASITARSQTIRLGRQVLLAPNCIIVDSDFHAPWPAENRASSPGIERDAPVDIGDYVWVGMNCIILKGVSIGRNSIVAAGSVVASSLPDNCLAAGVPARVIRHYEAE